MVFFTLELSENGLNMGIFGSGRGVRGEDKTDWTGG